MHFQGERDKRRFLHALHLTKWHMCTRAQMFQNVEGKEERKTSVLGKNPKKSHSKIYAT